ncbi:MAG: hypothetical protein VX589_11800 [Myxococcota bacterium]|nr:hypothetical protein [Myxococcota bacterium]
MEATIRILGLCCLGVLTTACGSASPTADDVRLAATDTTEAAVPSATSTPAPTESATPSEGEPTQPMGRPNTTPVVGLPETSGPRAPAPPPAPPAASAEPSPDDRALFNDMMDNHWIRIFPNGGRNAGGPQFFKYIYEKLATSHDLFKRYSRFYCGVSGSIVKPGGERYDVVKIKDANGQCIVGKYHRCCWPCSCDIMKHARAEQVTMALPNDETQANATYWVLTIDDPCGQCDVLPCPDLPREVTAYDCGGGVTRNGLRVKDGQLTEGADGRLIFAVLMDAKPASEASASVDVDLMRMCQRRIDATPAVLDTLGGMGDIFVKLALVNSNETFTNSNADLCE